jgi:hypothetical protein
MAKVQKVARVSANFGHKDARKMRVSEMDLVNTLISMTLQIEQLDLSERERALAYFDFIQRDVEADLAPYAAKFDDLLRDASSQETLKRLKESARRVRKRKH